MIAVGATVTFADKFGGNEINSIEPNSGADGVVKSFDGALYFVTFPNGQVIWACPDELTAA